MEEKNWRFALELVNRVFNLLQYPKLSDYEEYIRLGFYMNDELID